MGQPADRGLTRKVNINNRTAVRLLPGGCWNGRIIWLKSGARSGVCGCCGVFGNMPGIGAALKGGIDFEAFRRNTEAWARSGYRLVYKRFKERIPKLKRTQASARYSHLFWCGCRAVYTNLLCREFTAEAPNRKWATDVTEFAVDGQKFYLSPIIDLYNGEVVSYALARNPRFELVTRMLDKAFTRIKGATDLMLHSDQGWQYQMAQYRKRLQMKGIRQSMFRKGNELSGQRNGREFFLHTQVRAVLHPEIFIRRTTRKSNTPIY